MNKFFASCLKEKKKIDLFLIVILLFYFGIASCSILGIGGKQEEPAPVKEEVPPPPKPEALPPKPEVTPAPPPPPQVPPPVKEAQPPVAPAPVPAPPPPPEPKKEEVKPTPAAMAVYVITLKNANVRSEPDLKSRIIITLKKGTKVEKIGQTGEWVHVKLASGKTGWIFHELVKEVE